MKILIAGNGFIGRKVAEELRDSHIVKTLDRGAEATFQQDITEKFSLDEEFDVLIHSIGLAPGMHSREKYEKVHVEGTENLVEGINCEKIVFLSALGAGEVNHSFFRTKKSAEEAIQGSGKQYTILRPSTVYGRENKLLDLMRKAAPTRVFPDIRTETQPIHIDDLTEIIALSNTDFDNQALELGGRKKITIGKLAKKIYRKEGYNCVLIPTPEILKKAGFTLLDPLPGPFNRENIHLMENQNTTSRNDAEQILDSLKKI